MNKQQVMAGIMLAVAAVAVQAKSVEDKIRDAVESRLGEGAKLHSVTKTPYAGLYELHVDSDIIYTDATGSYLFIGNVLDTKTYQNFTKARVDEINKIKMSDLPLDKAIKTVKGNGKRVVAVFEDPNCGYCKRLHQNLQSVNNVTVYTFAYNILSQDSITKSRNIVCSADPAKAWADWMLNGKMAANAPASCKGNHEEIFALGQKLGITGTPTIFFEDGSRAPGALSAKDIEAKLSSIK